MHGRRMQDARACRARRRFQTILGVTLGCCVGLGGLFFLFFGSQKLKTGNSNIVNDAVPNSLRIFQFHVYKKAKKQPFQTQFSHFDFSWGPCVFSPAN